MHGFIVLQNVNTPMLLSKLPRLKKLDIRLLGLEPAFSPHYDSLSLISFLQASPALDSFILRVSHYPYTSQSNYDRKMALMIILHGYSCICRSIKMSCVTILLLEMTTFT
jgi:hypothetical protein